MVVSVTEIASLPVELIPPFLLALELALALALPLPFPLPMPAIRLTQSEWPLATGHWHCVMHFS